MFSKHIVSLLLLASSTSLYAANDYPPPQDRQGGMPPPQDQRNLPPPNVLADVCKNKKVGDSVSLKSPQGQKMVGSCRLMWVPEGQPPAPPQDRQQDRQMPPPR